MALHSSMLIWLNADLPPDYMPDAVRVNPSLPLREPATCPVDLMPSGNVSPRAFVVFGPGDDVLSWP